MPWNCQAGSPGNGARKTQPPGVSRTAGFSEGGEDGRRDGPVLRGRRDAALPALKVEAFAVGEVPFPGCPDPSYQRYCQAALRHNILLDAKEKIGDTSGRCV